MFVLLYSVSSLSPTRREFSFCIKIIIQTVRSTHWVTASSQFIATQNEMFRPWHWLMEAWNFDEFDGQRFLPKDLIVERPPKKNLLHNDWNFMYEHWLKRKIEKPHMRQSAHYDIERHTYGINKHTLSDDNNRANLLFKPCVRKREKKMKHNGN